MWSSINNNCLSEKSIGFLEPHKPNLLKYMKLSSLSKNSRVRRWSQQFGSLHVRDVEFPRTASSNILEYKRMRANFAPRAQTVAPGLRSDLFVLRNTQTSLPKLYLHRTARLSGCTLQKIFISPFVEIPGCF